MITMVLKPKTNPARNLMINTEFSDFEFAKTLGIKDYCGKRFSSSVSH